MVKEQVMAADRSRRAMALALCLLFLSVPQAAGAEQSVGSSLREKMGNLGAAIKASFVSGDRVVPVSTNLPGHVGDVQYIHVQTSAGSELSQPPLTYPERLWLQVKRWTGLGGRNRDAVYAQAHHMRNKAGESWEEAVGAARQSWESTRGKTQQSWDDAKRAAWDGWASTVDWSKDKTARVAEDTKAKASGVYGTVTEKISGAAKDAWTRTSEGTKHQAERISSSASSAVQGTTSRIQGAASEAWREALSTAYDAYAAGTGKSKQSWEDAKSAAWQAWKTGKGKAYEGYDAATDSVTDAYERALDAAHENWKATKAPESWESARDSFTGLWRRATESWEDAQGHAWEEWQKTKEKTGQTWDDASAQAKAHWNDVRSSSLLAPYLPKAAPSEHGWLRSAFNRWWQGREQPKAGTWDEAKLAAQRTYNEMTSTGTLAWDKVKAQAKEAYEAAAAKSGISKPSTLEQATERAWRNWYGAKAYTGSSWKQARALADDYWRETKGATKEGYDNFMDAAYENWNAARNSAGQSWEEAERNARDYYGGGRGGLFGKKEQPKKNWTEAGQQAWDNWVRASSARGGSFADVESAAKKRWEATKDQTNETWSQALKGAHNLWTFGTTQPSWRDTLSDSIACRWDDAKCKAGDAWDYVAKSVGPTDAEKARAEAHAAIDETYDKAKAEL